MPSLNPYLGYYLEVYQTLKMWRGSGFDGPSRLSLADMASYFWIHGVPLGAAREDLLYHIKRLEFAELNYEHKKKKSDTSEEQEKNAKN